HFRVEWEKAAWSNAGSLAAETNAKRMLLRWRLQTLLGELTGDVHHYHEAAIARPDLPSTRGALGCALARQGRATEVISHQQVALAANPFDRHAARALYEVLGNSGMGLAQRKLATERWQLSQVAPEAVPAEDWFANKQPRQFAETAAHESLAIVWEGAHAA